MRAGLLAAALLTTTLGTSLALATEPGDLSPRRPDRLIVESGERVSDGRKLQTEAEGSLRRAEDRPVVQGRDADLRTGGTGGGSAGDSGKAGR
jgi:hypothetical protein